MAEIDNPLKIHFANFAFQLIPWVMKVRVQWVEALNVELPAQASRMDLFFRVIDEQGRLVFQHIEFQGRRSHEPMPLRELGYLAHLVRREVGLSEPKHPVYLQSSVIYVGVGAGSQDEGRYEVWGLSDVTVKWQYQVIRLWQMPASELLAQAEPALAALIGLSYVQNAATELPLAIERVRQVTDPEQKGRLLTALVSLLPTEEMTTMVEKLLEQQEELLLDTPYLRRIRHQGLEEGVQIGRQEGVQIGREEGVQIGREEGLRQSILTAASRRLSPSATEYLKLSWLLGQIHSPELLQDLLIRLFDVEEMPAFLAAIEQTIK